MSQKGFANIVLFIIVVALIAIVPGSLAFVKKAPRQTARSILTPTQQSPATRTEQKPTRLPDGSQYPYTLSPLPQDRLSILRSEFTASNGNICAQINEYGFTEFKSGCLGGIVRIEIADEAGIVEMVKNWLVQNSKFTGVMSKSDAIVDRIIKLDGCIKCDPPVDRKVIEIRIDFRRQAYDGLPVEGDISPLTVFANANGISRIDGHWFPMITVPLEPKISETSTKNKLKGRTFTYSDKAGKPRDYLVTEKDLRNSAHEVIFVKKTSPGLEFRLAWEIQVGQGLSWTIYIDAITGEELKVAQMFQT